MIDYQCLLVTGELGVGGFSKVYKATLTHKSYHAVTVAVKAVSEKVDIYIFQRKLNHY